MSEQDNGKRSFDPREHLVQLKSRQGSQDYLPVSWRIVAFREKYPHGTIDTQEVVIDLDREVEIETYVWNNERRKSEKVTKKAKGYARFRTVVTDGEGGRATGTKSENAANFADFVEKSETGSIGRALAGLGFGTAYAAEFDEGDRVVDAPVPIYPQGALKGTLERETARNSESPVEHGTPVQNSPESQHTPSNGHSSAARESAQEVGTGTSASGIPLALIEAIRKGLGILGKSEPEDLLSMTYVDARTLHAELTAEYRSRKQQQQTSAAS